MIAGDNISFAGDKVFLTSYFYRTTNKRQPHIHPYPCDLYKNILSFWFWYQPAKHRWNKNDKKCNEKGDKCPQGKYATEYFFYNSHSEYWKEVISLKIECLIFGHSSFNMLKKTESLLRSSGICIWLRNTPSSF